uniref:Calcium uniporter protein n=2 Tax=Macrostomum lignano TaxID=282301 RepID=A0A1I8GPK2_9PLAT
RHTSTPVLLINMLAGSQFSFRLATVAWRPVGIAVCHRSLCSVATSASVVYQDGLPRFRIPLPSRGKACQFTMKPLTNTVSDLTASIRNEDRGVEQIIFYTSDGLRIAGSDSIESLLRRDFDVQLNDQRFAVTVPESPVVTHESVDQLADVKAMISQLHSALNTPEYQLAKEKELMQQLQDLQLQLEPMEAIRGQLAEKASRRTRILTWLSLSYMGVQFGVLARLTWWEYSWDIMEPVTYFVGYGTAIACYAYYVLTKQEYTFPAVWDREYLKKFYKDADKSSFNVEQYNELRQRINDVQSDLRRLRDPLMLGLPLQQEKLMKPQPEQQ